MNRQIRILSITFTLLILCGVCGRGELFAQQQPPQQQQQQQQPQQQQREHEFSVFGGGGLSTFRYEAAAGEKKSGLGMNFGVDYRFFFSPKWGVGTGLEFSLLNAELDIKNLDISYIARDNEEETDFEFRSTVRNLKEKHNAMLLKIPMMLQFRTEGEERRYYAAAGVKVGIPLKGKYDTSADIRNCGRYEFEENSPCYDTQTFRGFGNFQGKESSGDVNFKAVFFLSVEGGVKWKFGDKWLIYTGAYLDYGLNNILDKQKVELLPYLVEYNSDKPSEFTLNGAVNSKFGTVQRAPQAIIDAIKPMSVGIKVSVVLGKQHPD